MIIAQRTVSTSILSLLTMALILLIASPTAVAQEHDRAGGKKHKTKRDKLRAQKVTFISNRLSLTPEEAEGFWPVYNEYEKKSGEIHEDKRRILKLMKMVDEMDEKEAYAKMKQLLNLETKHARLRLTYLAKFATVLDKKRAAKVYIIEEKWKRMLLNKLDKKNHNGRGGPHHKPKD